MTKALDIILSIAVLAGIGYMFYDRYASSGEPYGDDDACVRDHIESSKKKLRADFKALGFDMAARSRGGVGALSKRSMDLGLVQTLEDLDRYLDHNCMLLPLPISNAKITDYPVNPPPVSCDQDLGVVHPSDIPQSTTVGLLSKQVGRLGVMKPDDSLPYHGWTMWATGFMIGDGVFATTCHAIESLRAIDPDLQIEGEIVGVDFQEENYPSGEKSLFKVQGVLQCTGKSGLDIALLSLPPKNENGDDLPTKLPIYAGSFEDVFGDAAALVGYADLDNFVEIDKQKIYSVFRPNGNGKFAMLDFILNKDTCDEKQGFDIVLDADTTTAGESGSPVLDVQHKDGTRPAPFVIGVHTCCSAYFPEDRAQPPQRDLSCARLKRTFDNQDVSSRAILKDPVLCPELVSKHADLRNYDGSQATITCDVY